MTGSTEHPTAGDLVRVTERGPRCNAGGFFVDPWSPVDLAIVTHAHADHASAGSKRYIASPETAAVMRTRLGATCPVEALDYGTPIELGGTRVSLHPAGHVLGSAQVRIEPTVQEAGSDVWVITGDFKTRPDPTCLPYEPVACDVFVTESTFALPIYRWPDEGEVFTRINDWRRANASEGKTSVLLAYSFGKAQRVLAGLDPAVGPIGVHGAVDSVCAVYRELGVDLPPYVHAAADTAGDLKGVGTIIAPPSAAEGPWIRKFKGLSGVRTAMVSGWMSIRGRRRWRTLDAGFVLSDHADWNDLLGAIKGTGARRVGVTHGYAAPFARYLREVEGLDAFVFPTRHHDEDEVDA